MRDIIVGAQYRAEPLAGARAYHLQKLPRLPVAVPSLLDGNAPPVWQDKGWYIYRIAVRMFGQPPAASDRPTIIGAERLDPLDLRAQDQPRGRLHPIARPGREIRCQPARHRAQIGGRHADVE